MTRIATALALGAAIALVAAPRGHAQSPQTPPVVFRTNADLVTIPVFVKGRGADTPLTSKDFVLTDNGVAQTVEMLESESLPVDVTVLMETGAAIEGYRKSLNEQVRRIAALMRPTDRIEVLGIDNYVHVLVPFGPPTRTLTVEAFTGGGMMAPNDAIVAALLRQADPDRRHLVIAMSDTIDSMSTLTMAQVRDVAKHSQATLVISWITLSADGAPSTDRPTPWATSGEREDRHVKAPVTLGALPLLGIPGLPQHTPTPPTGRTVPVRQHWMAHYDPPPGRALAAFDFLK